MGKVNLLPKWILPDTIPSVYDTDSGTCIEMVAKVYGAMTNLQKEYNSFVDEINKTIIDFTNSIEQDQECFKEKITKIMHDYIMKIDEKIKMQDLVINEAVIFMKDNLSASINQLVEDMKESGELDQAILEALDNLGVRVETLENTEYTLEYEEETENLILKKTVKEVE